MLFVFHIIPNLISVYGRKSNRHTKSDRLPHWTGFYQFYSIYLPSEVKHTFVSIKHKVAGEGKQKSFYLISQNLSCCLHIIIFNRLIIVQFDSFCFVSHKAQLESDNCSSRNTKMIQHTHWHHAFQSFTQKCCVLFYLEKYDV